MKLQKLLLLLIVFYTAANAQMDKSLLNDINSI